MWAVPPAAPVSLGPGQHLAVHDGEPAVPVLAPAAPVGGHLFQIGAAGQPQFDGARPE